MRIKSRILLIFSAAGLVAGPALAIEFSPHRAIYDVTLDQAPSGAVSEVSGTLSIDWQLGCSGWTFEYRSVIDVTQAESGRVRLSTVATTWESATGSEYRFNVRHSTNGHELEKIEGYAVLRDPGADGTVKFTAPRERTMALPAGTLFPMAHSMAVMKAAVSRKAPVFLPLSVFDGMDVQGLYLVNAVIGKSPQAGAASPGGSPEVSQLQRDQRAWPVSLAYFKTVDRQPAPSHEMRLLIYENGVSDQLVIDFGDFRIRARIEKLEIQPPTDCNGP